MHFGLGQQDANAGDAAFAIRHVADGGEDGVAQDRRNAKVCHGPWAA